MKKIIFIAIALMALIGCEVQAQSPKALSLNQWVYGDDTDYSLSTSGDSVLTYTITLNKPEIVLYDVQVVLDSVDGTPDYVVDLKGKVFEDDAWSDLETDVAWTGTSADTTILFQEHSTAEFYRIFQLQVNGQALTGAAALSKFELKVWP